MKMWKKLVTNKKKKVAVAVMLIGMLGICSLTACGSKEAIEADVPVAETEEVKTETPAVEAVSEEAVEIEIDPAYKLVWEDNFDGTELNRDDWNVELHDPGWVNAEWQEYVD